MHLGTAKLQIATTNSFQYYVNFSICAFSDFCKKNTNSHLSEKPLDSLPTILYGFYGPLHNQLAKICA